LQTLPEVIKSKKKQLSKDVSTESLVKNGQSLNGKLSAMHRGQWTLSTLTSQNKNGGISVGTFVNFVWVTIGENFFNAHISAKEDKEL